MPWFLGVDPSDRRCAHLWDADICCDWNNASVVASCLGHLRSGMPVIFEGKWRARRGVTDPNPYTIDCICKVPLYL